MGSAGNPPRFTFVTARVAAILLGLILGFGSPPAAGAESRGGASILLTKTVGTVPEECATTDSITVAAGTTVTYCYEVENTGSQSFTTHTLVDDQLGTLLDDFSLVLDPASSFSFTQAAQIMETTVNNATWTAVGTPDNAAAGDSATVEVAVPAIDLFKTVGTDPETCAKETSIALDLPAEVTYCYEAHNAGNVTFSLHDLVDDQLGILLDDHVEDLEPSQFLQVLATTEIVATTVNVATWTANDPFFAEASNLATVTSGLIFEDGFESGDTSAW